MSREIRAHRRALSRAGSLLLLAAAAAGQGAAPPTAVPFTPDEIETILELAPLPEPPADPTNAVYEDAAAARLGQASSGASAT